MRFGVHRFRASRYFKHLVITGKGFPYPGDGEVYSKCPSTLPLWNVRAYGML